MMTQIVLIHGSNSIIEGSSRDTRACSPSSTPLSSPDSFFIMQMIDAEKLRYCVENETSGDNSIANAVLRIYLPEDVTFRYVGFNA